METTQVQVKVGRTIGILMDKIDFAVKADDALKYTQAALNAAHTIMVVMNTPKE